MPHDPLTGALAAACSPTHEALRHINLQLCDALGVDPTRLLSVTIVLRFGELPVLVTRRHVREAGALRQVVERLRLVPVTVPPGEGDAA